MAAFAFFVTIDGCVKPAGMWQCQMDMAGAGIVPSADIEIGGVAAFFALADVVRHLVPSSLETSVGESERKAISVSALAA